MLATMVGSQKMVTWKDRQSSRAWYCQCPVRPLLCAHLQTSCCITQNEPLCVYSVVRPSAICVPGICHYFNICIPFYIFFFLIWKFLDYLPQGIGECHEYCSTVQCCQSSLGISFSERATYQWSLLLGQHTSNRWLMPVEMRGLSPQLLLVSPQKTENDLRAPLSQIPICKCFQGSQHTSSCPNSKM